jgi:hypothetical protein
LTHRRVAHAIEFHRNPPASFRALTLTITITHPPTAHPPAQVLSKVDEYHRIRLRLSADIADSSNVVKAMVIRAEDARLLCSMPAMRRAYGELHAQNRELIGECVFHSVTRRSFDISCYLFRILKLYIVGRSHCLFCLFLAHFNA